MTRRTISGPPTGTPVKEDARRRNGRPFYYTRAATKRRAPVMRWCCSWLGGWLWISQAPLTLLLFNVIHSSTMEMGSCRVAAAAEVAAQPRQRRPSPETFDTKETGSGGLQAPSDGSRHDNSSARGDVKLSTLHTGNMTSPATSLADDGNDENSWISLLHLLSPKVDDPSSGRRSDAKKEAPVEGGLLWDQLAVTVPMTGRTHGLHSPKSNQTQQDPTTQIPPRSHRRRFLLSTCSGILGRGRVCGVIGPSGSGKSTLVSALAGMQTLPTHGQVWAYSLLPTDDDSSCSSSSTSSSSFPSNINPHHLDTANKVNASNSFHDNASPASAELAQEDWWQAMDEFSIPSSSSSARRRGKNQKQLYLYPVQPSQVAWLQQQDVFFDMLTVRETLQMAAFLEWPDQSTAKRNQLIDQHLDALGLAAVAERPLARGSSSSASSAASLASASSHRLSGGERRRLSVAVELLTDKQLLIADEPTSGLDSTMALRVMRLIKDLVVQRNIPCLCVLHQPRSAVWHMLDDIILMAPGGRVCYAGRRDEAVSTFAEWGYPCPAATNPAEFLLDLVSIDAEDEVKAAADEARVAHLAQSFRQYQRKQRQRVASSPNREFPSVSSSVMARSSPSSFHPRHSVASSGVNFPVGRWIRRWAALFRRSWRQNIRNRATNLFRLVASVGNAFLLVQIFPNIRGRWVWASTVADRCALLTYAAVILTNMAYMKAADLFAKEKPVVHREQTRRQHSSLEYLVAKIAAEFPLDASFAAVFSTLLKQYSGLRISWSALTALCTMATVGGAAMGFFLGALLPTEGLAVNAGIPILVVLMIVGVVNPSGVDPNRATPWLVEMMKRISPFHYIIESLLLCEFRGMQFQKPAKSSGLFKRLAALPKMGALAMVRDGDQVIQVLGLNGKFFSTNMQHLALVSTGYLILSWICLSMHQWRDRWTRSSANKQKVDQPTLRFEVR